MGRLEGKVAIVTGGGQGIGKGIALAFAKEGAKVAIAESRSQTCEEAAEEIRKLGIEALGIVCDVRDKEQVERMLSEVVAKFGTVDILVNNAQRYQVDKPVEELEEIDWDRCLQTGLKGTLYCCLAVLPYMKEKGGKIINFGSGVAIQGKQGTSAYNATKEGIRALSRTLAREWGKYKITVNVICPNARTPQSAPVMKDYDAIVKQSALGRWGDPEKDIGRVAVFFASEDSDFVTGQTLCVEGGNIMF